MKMQETRGRNVSICTDNSLFAFFSLFFFKIEKASMSPDLSQMLTQPCSYSYNRKQARLLAVLGIILNHGEDWLLLNRR